MRRKGESSFKWRARHHRFAACFRVHFPRPPRGLEIEHAAAQAISGGDYLSKALFDERYNVAYLFTSADQAHAMQIWFEANARPYDEWEEKVGSWTRSDRERREQEGMINAAAATGATRRLERASRAGGRRAAVSLLREIEPSFDQMSAERAVALIFSQ